jgi:hypothetical protein
VLWLPLIHANRTEGEELDVFSKLLKGRFQFFHICLNFLSFFG